MCLCADNVYTYICNYLLNSFVEEQTLHVTSLHTFLHTLMITSVLRSCSLDEVPDRQCPDLQLKQKVMKQCHFHGSRKKRREEEEAAEEQE